MFDTFRSLMHAFRDAPTGDRFQRLYRRREARPNGLLMRSCFLATGVAVMALGVVLMPAPGPGVIVLVFGAGIAAQESLRVARAMDRCEVGLATLVKRSLQWWRNRSSAAKAVLIATTAGSAASLGIAGYRVIAAF